MCRENATRYQEAAENHTGSRKLSSANYFNCENLPIDTNLADNVKVIDVYAPPPLHVTSGVFNDLFNALEQTLLVYNSTMKATDWSDTLSLTREGHYGGTAVFKGRQCRKMLKTENIGKLKSLLIQHNSDSYCEPFVKCFEALHAVVESCMGMVQYPRYPSDIRAFAKCFFEARDHAGQINTLKNLVGPQKIHVSVTLKTHEIFVHTRQYLENQKDKNDVEFGSGFYSEQR